MSSAVVQFENLTGESVARSKDRSKRGRAMRNLAKKNTRHQGVLSTLVGVQQLVGVLGEDGLTQDDVVQMMRGVVDEMGDDDAM